MPTRIILTRDILQKRKVTLVGGDNPAQPIYILADYIDDYYLSHGPYAPILHKCIDLARRFVFSEPGMRMAPQALVGSWTAGCAIASSANKQQLEKLYAEAAYQVQSFGQQQSMRIVVESRVYRGVHALCAEPSTVWLSSSLAQQAAEAESRYLDEGSPLEARVKRDQHVFYIAVLIAHGLQQAMRGIVQVPSTNDYPRCFPANGVSPIPHRLITLGPRQRRKLMTEKSGWRWEELMFGGHVFRLFEPWRPSKGRTYLLGSTTGIGVARQDGVLGHVLITEHTIQEVVDGKQDWNHHLPLSIHDFIAGEHLDADHRADDGSEEGRRLAMYTTGRPSCGTH